VTGSLGKIALDMTTHFDCAAIERLTGPAMTCASRR
jgi:hypothetical protein